MSAPTQKLLILGHVWPEPAATAAGKRMIQLLRSLSDRGFQIHFGSSAAKTPYSTSLSEFVFYEKKIALNDSGFDEFVRELKPDLVIFDRFMTEEQFGWRVAENSPGSLRILNTEDLHSLRDVRARQHDKCLKFGYKEWLNSDLTKRELASIYRSDLSLIISQYEMDLLLRHGNIPENLLFYLPFLAEEDSTDSAVNDKIDFDNRRDFIFVGNGKHSPNIDAIYWLKTEIWPLIHQQLPDSKMQVYGAYLPEKIKALHEPKENFFVNGWIENSEHVVSKARVNLAPLRFGAGLKGKIMEAMAVGTPSVGTTTAWEGFPVDKEFESNIKDNAADFADLAIEFYKKRAKWSEHQIVQYELYASAFKEPDHMNSLEEVIAHLRKDLSSHRTNNIVGAMLMYHSMASTKYMSKWIEAKNKDQDKG